MQSGVQEPQAQPDAFAQTSVFELGLSAFEVFDLLPIGVQVDDARHHTIYVNARFTEMTGYTREDIADLEDWFRLAYPDAAERAAVRRDWAARLAEAEASGRDIAPIERCLTCKDGEQRVFEFHVRRIGAFYVYLNIDVSHRKALADDMRRLAFTDSLTGQGNRRSFLAAGEALLAERCLPLAGLMVDIDHFKSLNDRYGHKVGDEALMKVATRLGALLSADQHLARLGGEEFGVLLPGCDAEAAAAVAERLRLAVTERPLILPSLSFPVPVCVCVGGALAAPGDRTLDGLLARADRALYDAKRGGRNRVRFSEG
ncbi:GGDEF domain-containing protein [Acidisoma sp. 7E03]